MKNGIGRPTREQKELKWLKAEIKKLYAKVRGWFLMRIIFYYNGSLFAPRVGSKLRRMHYEDMVMELDIHIYSGFFQPKDRKFLVRLLERVILRGELMDSIMS